MRNELSDRQHAICMCLAGETVATICRVLQRSEAWVRKWGHRYLNAGGEGLYDLSRAHHAVVDRTSPHIERAVLSIRRRLAAQATPQTRYAFMGAATIREELRSLGFTPIPSLRTIERILQRHNLTSPRLRLARCLPRMVQFDNGRQFYGPGRYARSLNRVIRLVLRLAVEPVFIPEASPQRNGSVENFNGWFQPLLLQRPFARAGDVRRELRRLLWSVNDQHVHQSLGFRTPTPYRRRKRIQKLPARFALDLQNIPVAAGKLTFIRWVPAHGYVDVLGESLKVGRRLRFHYIKITIETHTQRLKVYHNGRLMKHCVFKLRIS